MYGYVGAGRKDRDACGLSSHVTPRLLMPPTRPDASEFPPFYGRYIDLVPDGRLADVLRAQPDAYARLLAGADPGAAYAPGKWSVGQVLAHVVDTERVFAFRMLWFARGAALPGSDLPGFDQDAWADVAPVASVEAGLADFRAVRAATVALAESLDGAAWTRSGVANGNAMTARAAVYVIAGHPLAHAAVLRERYGLTG